MCGMFGIADSGRLGFYDRQLFEGLMFINVLRGEDSTGIAVVQDDYKCHFRKSLDAGYDFLKSSKVREDLQTDSYHKTSKNTYTSKSLRKRAFMGHTRHATKGATNVSNAHPFNYPNFVGFHNGTINWPDLGKDESDSKYLFDKINRGSSSDFSTNIYNALKETEEIIDAAYALQLYNIKDRTLYFIRNSLRPLHFSYMAGFNSLVWSSSGNHLHFMMEENNKKGLVLGNDDFGKFIKKKSDSIFTVNTNVLFSVDLKNWTIGFDEFDIKEKKQKTTTYYYGSNFNNTTTSTSTTNTTSQRTSTDEAIEEKKCSICCEDINTNEKFVTLVDNSICCEHCSKQDWMQDYIDQIGLKVEGARA